MRWKGVPPEQAQALEAEGGVDDGLGVGVGVVQREAAARAETFTILDLPKARLLATALGEGLRRPGRALATLRLALRHRVPGAKALVWALFHFVEALVLREDDALDVLRSRAVEQEVLDQLDEPTIR